MIKYITKLLKGLLEKNIAEQPKPASWSDILNKETNVLEEVVIKKRSRIMLLPSRSVILWKTREGEPGSKKNVQEGVNLMFKFEYKGEKYSINMRRPCDQNLTKTALPKIRMNMLKKLQYAQLPAEEIKAAEEVLKIDVTPNNGFDDIKMLDLIEKDLIQRFEINGEEYSIQKGAPPIMGVHLELTALSKSILMASIEFSPNFGEIEKSKWESEAKYHWFVRDEIDYPLVKNKNNVLERSTKIEFLNEEKRIFSVTGFTYKNTGPLFEPMKEYTERSIIVIVDVGPEHPVRATISTRSAKDGPDELVTDEQVNWCRENQVSKNEIRVMTYNVLADNYLNLKLEQKDLFFNYCPKPYQRFFYRTPLLLKQMKEFSENGVSIFFLQEVDKGRIQQYYSKLFQVLDFGFVFCKKRLQIGEGLAIAYCRRKFKLIEYLEFGISELICEEEDNRDVMMILESSPEVKERALSRGTVLQVVVFEDLEDKSVVFCGNTHLHHNPKEEYIKILQTLVISRKIYRLKKSMNETSRILFGGDFNSTPDGPVFELLSKGKLSKNHEAWKLDPNIAPNDIMLPNAEVFKCLSGIHKFTNYTSTGDNDGFIGCLDYIWGQGFETSRICPMPTLSKVVEFEAIPSKIAPSDHLPVIVDVKTAK